MAIVVAFLSQKGGVGKSTLARSAGVLAARMGLGVLLADLDPQQRTLMRWLKTRAELKLETPLRVEAFDDLGAALAQGGKLDLVLLDLPGQISNVATAVARNADLIVQPTSPSVDDLHPAVLVFHALERIGVAREKLVFALCRVLGDKEAEATRDYLADLGYGVLSGAINERLGYRDALNLGRTLVECRQPNMSNAAQIVLLDLLERALSRRLTGAAPAIAGQHPPRVKT
ncbi:MAG: ParA family protein [Hyphomicrobiaceae bacterium]|nr:ParA family protein [Hyphomicrobiaceae bacterium]